MSDLSCFRCGRTSDQIGEYVLAGEENGMTPDEYVRAEEGTLSREGRFCCTSCYIKIGMPSSPRGWVAP